MPLRDLFVIFLLLSLAGSISIASPAEAPDTGKNITAASELVSFVDEAVVYAQREGKAAALETFADPNGSFVRGDVYIWAYDFTGINLAHPFHPEFRGNNKLGLLDPDGFPMIEAMRDTALNGSGFVPYRYENPVTGAVESKLAYVKRVDDTWWLASGIYGEDLTITDTVPLMVRKSLVEKVNAAAAYADEMGKGAALETFNDPEGRFSENGSYIFAFDLNGTTLAMPFHHEMVDENNSGQIDLNGVSIGREKLRIAREGGGFWYYVFDNPDAGNRPEFKVSYILTLDDDWVIGTGRYLPGVHAGFATQDRDLLVSRVKEAVAYVRDHGRDGAIREFNDPEGQFSDPKMFVFAFDQNGTLLANPFLPGLVGMNRMNDQDPYGAYPPRQMIANAENGGGFAYFFFADPADGYRIRLKLAYTEQEDGLVVGSGIFAGK